MYFSRTVVGKSMGNLGLFIGHQHLREQPGGGDPLSKLSAWAGAWLSVRHCAQAHIATDVALDGEHTQWDGRPHP